MGLRICLVTVPSPAKIIGPPISNVLRILDPLSEELFVITGNYPESELPSSRIHLKSIRNEVGDDNPERSLLVRSLRYITAQVEMSYHLAKIVSRVDVVIFFMGGSALLLPMLVAKSWRKKTVVVTTLSAKKVIRNTYRENLWGIGGLALSSIFSILERLNYKLCDKIAVAGPQLCVDFGLKNYSDKIALGHEHFLDFDKFKIKNKFDKRDNLVGYIGRLSEEKGILNFVKAIPLILKEKNGLKFLIGGDGQLRKEIEKYINEKNLNHNIKFAGWISRDQLPNYMNELKLLVLPSYTEGLPNIMLEAMACGTPVLATPVGAIPDVIKDGETGFIMENNSPECIAENVIRALNHPHLEQVAKNARALVEGEFTYEKAVEGYREILSKV